MATAWIPAAALATGAYLNAKLSISKDLQEISKDREFGARRAKRIQELGDTCTIYRMLELANPEDELLWFEGNTWSYRELKQGQITSHPSLYISQRYSLFVLEVVKLGAFLTSVGIANGEIVAVFTTNSPEMVIAILALSKIGAVAGLINTSLRGMLLFLHF